MSARENDGLDASSRRLPRLLLAITLSRWGGAQAYVYRLARAARSRFEVRVVCGPGGELADRLRAEGIGVAEIPEFGRDPDPWRDGIAFWRLKEILREGRFDLVHLNVSKAGLLGRLAVALQGVSRVLYTPHGWAFTERQSRWKWGVFACLERLASRVTDRVICVSKHERALALRWRVARDEQIRVIPNGVDPGPFRGGDRAAVRRSLGLGEAPAIVMVGRLADPKDPVTLLEAARRLPQGTVVLVGEGPMGGLLERLSRSMGPGRVRLLGAREDVPAVLQACDIFVLSSRSEALPFSVIEAMMAGLPVVASRVGGVPELVENGTSGILVPPSDVAALSDAIRGLMDDAALRRRMGEEGRRRALREFTEDRMIERTFEVYREILERRPRGR